MAEPRPSSSSSAAGSGLFSLEHLFGATAQDTLIVWSESDTCDLALSFQEKAGCDSIWQKICHVNACFHLFDVSPIEYCRCKAKILHWSTPASMARTTMTIAIRAPTRARSISTTLACRVRTVNSEFYPSLSVVCLRTGMHVTLPKCEVAFINDINELFSTCMHLASRREHLANAIEHSK